jgi:hypothetical protein
VALKWASLPQDVPTMTKATGFAETAKVTSAAWAAEVEGEVPQIPY